MNEISGSFTASSLIIDVEKTNTTTLTLSGTPSTEFENKELGTVSIRISKYGWISQDGKFYYYDSTGQMVTGWQTDIPGREGRWFYFGTDGAMNTGWVEIDGTWYYFNETGELVKSSVDAPNE